MSGRPLPKLLVELRGSEVTGLVQIREGAGRQSSLYVRRGRPVHVVRPDALDRLDQVLVEGGLLSAQDLLRAEAVRASSGQLLGQVLRQLGLVDDHQLAQALRWQLRRKVTRLFTSAGTVDVAATDHPFGADEASPGTAIEPRALVLPGILASYDGARLRSELAVLSGRLVKLGPIGVSQLGELGFKAGHGPLLTQLQQRSYRVEPRWVDGETDARGLEAKSILLTLFYLDLLEFPDEAGKPELVPGAQAPAAPVEAAPPAQPALDVAQLAILGERCFRRGDLVHAEQLFEEASRLDARNQRVRAYLIWIHFWKQAEGRRQALLEQTLTALRQVVKADPQFGYGYYFVGKLLKLRNDPKKAEQAFRAAVQHDLELLDAQRELHLMHIRRS